MCISYACLNDGYKISGSYSRICEVQQQSNTYVYKKPFLEYQPQMKRYHASNGT